jgi:cytoskeletal protein CcmA (bactofilin family)
MAEQMKQTVIESGTQIDGTIKSERPIVLSGHITGKITAPSLEITKEGTVNGTVTVNQFSCKGEVGGEVIAESVELAGRVSDSTVIKSKSLDVKLAQGEGGVQVTFGNCELHVGDLPARPAAKPKATTTDSSKVADAQSAEAKVIDVVSELMK